MESIRAELKIAGQLEKENKTLHAIQIYHRLLQDKKNKTALVRLASIYAEMGNISATANLAQYYFKYFPEDETLKKHFAGFLVENSHNEKALEILATVASEKNSEALFLKGVANYNLGNYDFAKINFADYLTQDPESELIWAVYYYMSQIEKKSGDYDNALKHAKKANEYITTLPELQFLLAELYYEKGMYLHASEIIRWSKKDDLKNPAVLKLAGKIFYQLNEYDKAADYLEQNVAKSPADSYIFSILGESYLQKRNYSKAKVYFKKALSLDPSNKLSLEGMKKISNK